MGIINKIIFLTTIIASSIWGDVIVDDFNDQLPHQTKLGRAFSLEGEILGTIKVSNDSKDGGNSSANPDYISDPYFVSGLDEDSYDGNCLHLEIDLGDGFDSMNSAYYEIYIPITISDHYHNFSKVSSVSFYCKGEGYMNVGITTKLADVDYSNDWGQFSHDFSLTQSWEKVNVPISEFEPEAYSGISKDQKELLYETIKECSGLVFIANTVKMLAGDTISFFLDDIVLNGIDSSDFTVQHWNDTNSFKFDTYYANVAIDDFEDSPENDGDNQGINYPDQSDLGARFNYYIDASNKHYASGRWYTYNETKNTNYGSFAYPNYFDDSVFNATIGTDENHYVALDIRLQNTSIQSFFGIGLNLTEDSIYNDISDMTNINFYASGEGEINVMFIGKADSIDVQMIYPIHLNREWTKYTIDVNTFYPLPNTVAADSNISWSDCNKTISKLHFETSHNLNNGDTILFNLDGIGFNGVNYSDFTYEKDGETFEVGKTKSYSLVVPIEGVKVKTRPTLIVDDSTIIKLDSIFDPLTDINFSANDYEDGNITSKVTAISYVDTHKTGRYSVLFSITDSDSLTYSIVTEVIVVDPTPHISNVIIDDFENSIEHSIDNVTNTANQTDLGARFNYFNSSTDMHYEAGYWYAYNDKEDGGYSSAFPDYIDDHEVNYGLSGNSDNQYLSIDITLTNTSSQPFYGIGCTFTEHDVYHDLSNMTGISLYARGEGEVYIMFVCKTALLDEVLMVSPITLSSTWTKYVINVDNFYPLPNSTAALSNVTWDDCKTQSTKLHFQTSQTMKHNDEVQLDLDGIELINVSYSDFDYNSFTVKNSDPYIPIVTTDTLDYITSIKTDFITNDNDMLTVGPMPITKNSKIFFNAPEEGTYHFEIYSMSESKISSLSLYAHRGLNEKQWKIFDSLSKGVYYLVAKKGSKTISIKRIVKAGK